MPFQEKYPDNNLENFNKYFEQYKTNEPTKQFAQGVLHELKQNKSPLIFQSKVNLVIWTYSYLLKNSLHYLEETEQKEAKEILNAIFNPSAITDYLLVVKNIKSVPNTIKETIAMLIKKHKMHQDSIKS